MLAMGFHLVQHFCPQVAVAVLLLVVTAAATDIGAAVEGNRTAAATNTRQVRVCIPPLPQTSYACPAHMQTAVLHFHLSLPSTPNPPTAHQTIRALDLLLAHPPGSWPPYDFKSPRLSNYSWVLSRRGREWGVTHLGPHERLRAAMDRLRRGLCVCDCVCV